MTGHRSAPNIAGINLRYQIGMSASHGYAEEKENINLLFFVLFFCCFCFCSCGCCCLHHITILINNNNNNNNKNMIFLYDCRWIESYLKSLFPKPLTSTPTCYSFAAQIHSKEVIFQHKIYCKWKMLIHLY